LGLTFLSEQGLFRLQAGQTLSPFCDFGSAIICVSPLVLWDVFWPPPFNITASKKSLTYEFKDASEAHAFTELNEDAEWIEVE